MREFFLNITTGLIFFCVTPAVAFDYSVITLKELKTKIQAPCAIVHYWAAWCENCISELPELMKFFEKAKGVEAVVIDLSANLAQERFSKTWLKKIAPNSKTFRKGSQENQTLTRLANPDWKGALPLTVLFAAGQKKKTWEETVSAEDLAKAVASFCPASR